MALPRLNFHFCLLFQKLCMTMVLPGARAATRSTLETEAGQDSLTQFCQHSPVLPSITPLLAWAWGTPSTCPAGPHGQRLLIAIQDVMVERMWTGEQGNHFAALQGNHYTAGHVDPSGPCRLLRREVLLPPLPASVSVRRLLSSLAQTSRHFEHFAEHLASGFSHDEAFCIMRS